MKISDLYLTLGITAGGQARVLYAGDDATRANTAMARAGKEYVEVGVVPHPQIVFPRNPSAEQQMFEDRAKAHRRRIEAELAERIAKIKAKNEEARKLSAEAQAEEAALKQELSGAPAPEEDPNPPKP